MICKGQWCSGGVTRHDSFMLPYFLAARLSDSIKRIMVFIFSNISMILSIYKAILQQNCSGFQYNATKDTSFLEAHRSKAKNKI